MDKIVTVVGARPQFVKAAAVSRALTGRFDERLVHTGQHYDANMSAIFFQEMGIPQPHYQLGIGGCTQGAMTGRMIEGIEALLEEERPAWLLIFGDTNSTLAAAIAAVKMQIPVAHVEAGLRSFNKRMPEEVNRIVADHCADLLFTPTAAATAQLQREGIAPDAICEVGDVMYDTLLHYRSQARAAILESAGVAGKQYALATIHRAESRSSRALLEELFAGLICVAHEQMPVVVPLHPATRGALEDAGLYAEVADRLTILEPIGYLDMIALLSHAALVLTDSGGLQKEAFFCSVPCVTLRSETEWVELVAGGYTRLPPLERNAIAAAAARATCEELDWSVRPYGDGDATEKIVDALAYR